MTQGLKAVDTKPDNQGPKWWEERINSHKLSADLHMSTAPKNTFLNI